MNIRLTVCMTMLAGSTGACAPFPAKTDAAPNNELTHGNVQMNLRVGETTQAQVLDVFGAPNITTIDGSGQEVWTYQRAATVEQSLKTSGFLKILLIGQTTSAAGGSRETSGFEQTQRMMTLIIKFGKENVVTDFRSRASEF